MEAGWGLPRQRLLREQASVGLGASEPSVVPFSQSLSTLALIEEFLGKREVPCPPGAEGQGAQKWVRNVSYFREFTAASFLGLGEVCLRLSVPSLPFCLRRPPSPSNAGSACDQPRSREGGPVPGPGLGWAKAGGCREEGPGPSSSKRGWRRARTEDC